MKYGDAPNSFLVRHFLFLYITMKHIASPDWEMSHENNARQLLALPWATTKIPRKVTLRYPDR